MLIEQLYRLDEEKSIDEIDINIFDPTIESDLIGRLSAEVPELTRQRVPGKVEPMSLLYDIIEYERKTAFKAGYQTAITLIMEGLKGNLSENKLEGETT